MCTQKQGPLYNGIFYIYRNMFSLIKDTGLVIIALLLQLMPRRVADAVLDWLFSPFRLAPMDHMKNVDETLPPTEKK